MYIGCLLVQGIGGVKKKNELILLFVLWGYTVYLSFDLYLSVWHIPSYFRHLLVANAVKFQWILIIFRTFFPSFTWLQNTVFVIYFTIFYHFFFQEPVDRIIINVSPIEYGHVLITPTFKENLPQVGFFFYIFFF